MKDGETFVSGRSPERARELLDAAEKAGMEAAVVRTTMGGYLVPTELVEGKSEKNKTEAKATAKPKTRTRAQKEN